MLIGHENIVADLKRLAKSGNLSHGYIFFGPAMVGKRTVAQALAKFLEKQEFVPWAEGEALQDAKVVDLASAKYLDPNVKNSIGIDAVREIKNFLSQKPNISARRTAIIDDCELLTAEAQNALLKITEEPPASALLILATSDIDVLLPTISSRLQKIYFGTVPQKEIVAWLADERGIAKKEAEEVAKKAQRKPGLALRLLEDNDLKEIMESAEKLFKLTPDKRRDFVKKLLEDEGFNFGKLLDAMILHLAANGQVKNAAQWHKFLALRQNAANFNLNPKLQLEALLTSY
jgi:DNA polymerase III delta prime subunit